MGEESVGVSHLQGEEKSQAFPELGHRGDGGTQLGNTCPRGVRGDTTHGQHWPWHLHGGITGWAWAGCGLGAGQDGVSPTGVGLWQGSGTVKDQRGSA